MHLLALMSAVLAFGSGQVKCSEWQTQRCSPEEIRVLLAEDGGRDAVRQKQPKEKRSLGYLIPGSKDPRVGDLTSGMGKSLASPTSSAGVCSCDGDQWLFLLSPLDKMY